MRLLALLLVAGALACTACAKSSASAYGPRAAESARLRVKFKSAFASPPVDMSERDAMDFRAAMQAERAIVERMRAAGYDVVEHGKWDVRMVLTVRVRDEDHAEATAVFFDVRDRVVDRMSVTTGPKRVASSFVDGVRESKKLKARQ